MAATATAPSVPNPNGPAMKAPPGFETDFDAADLSGPYLATFSLFLIVLGTFVPARLFTRYFVIKQWGSEDVVLLIGAAVAATFGGLTFPLYQAGYGKHLWNVRLRNIPNILFYLNVAIIFYDLSFMFIKTSILIQYRKIFVPRTRNTLWYSTWLLTLIFVLFYTTMAFLNIFTCNPRRKIWRPATPGRCIIEHPVPFYSATATFNGVTDVLILLMPQVTIWKLKLAVRRRVGLGVVFSVGILACVISFIRVNLVLNVLAHNPDVTYVGLQHGMLGTAELALGIICACLPVFPRFFESLVGKVSPYSRLSTATRRAFGRASQTATMGSARNHHGASEQGRAKRGVLEGTSLEELNVELSERELYAEGVNIEGGITKTVNIETMSENQSKKSREEGGMPDW